MTFKLGQGLATALACCLYFAQAVADAALEQAYTTLAAKRFVDLTHAFSPVSPVWKGFGQATMSAAADPESHRPYSIEHDGFRAMVYTLVGQYGTHVDPPAHGADQGRGMDAIPPSEMVLRLVVFDMTPWLAQDPNHALTVDDIRAWEERNGRVPQGAFAALRTDMYQDFERDPDKFKRFPFPAWSFAAIKFLFEERGVTAIGHEALDTDISEDLASERWLLQHDHWQIEVMANLDQVPATGALIVVSWPKVKHGFGFPARAFAIVP